MKGESYTMETFPLPFWRLANCMCFGYIYMLRIRFVSSFHVNHHDVLFRGCPEVSVRVPSCVHPRYTRRESLNRLPASIPRATNRVV